jgi:hypothetical protein
MKNVLAGLSQSDAEKVYKDQTLGLSSINSLYFWVQMLVEGGKTSNIYTRIISYFGD